MRQQRRHRQDPEKEQFWREVVHRQQQSRTTIRAFCETEGIAESAFYNWRAKLKRQDARQPAEEARQQRCATGRQKAGARSKQSPEKTVNRDSAAGRAKPGPTSHERPTERLIEELFSRISEVSSLPDVALRIVELVNDPDTESDDLLEAVRSDPALAMRLMRTVNSSYYALTEKVVDLKQAVTLLGFREVCNLALTAYVAKLFTETVGYGKYSRRGLWNHSVGVAMVARLLAKTCRRVSPQEAYLAGLLHDLGLILLDQYLHKPFCRVVDALTEATSLCEVERRLLGFDHAMLGEFVAVKWKLPEQLAAPIGCHHAPQEYSGPYRDMVYVVALANFFCHLKNLTSLGVRDMQTPPVQFFTDLGLRKEQFSLILDQLDEVLEAADVMAIVQVR